MVDEVQVPGKYKKSRWLNFHIFPVVLGLYLKYFHNGRKQETFFMHYKDFFLNKNDKIELVEKINSTRNDINQTIYVVGVVQFLAIVGSVLAILSFN
ncbi:hypothetical protein EDD80_106194 [Anseongella ginsenosidimutans]|uniref:Uncharacterized protein n=1 Tax=Anseongella ginsenosidimutans TaxID=496056 RepID=A0A4R3KR91_9SPHI|nr:hypothetical protein EDD80_106194 [Anseongella ginsenosidimutans]